MLFNSINYFIFLPVVFLINNILPYRFRWLLLLVASIAFYMFAGAATIVTPLVLIISTYISGILVEQASSVVLKKTYFLLGLSINMGLLFFFKYINYPSASDSHALQIHPSEQISFRSQK